MPEVDIGVHIFYNLDPTLNISTTLEIPLDEMRVVFPLQEEDQENDEQENKQENEQENELRLNEQQINSFKS